MSATYKPTLATYQLPHVAGNVANQKLMNTRANLRRARVTAPEASLLSCSHAWWLCNNIIVIPVDSCYNHRWYMPYFRRIYYLYFNPVVLLSNESRLIEQTITYIIASGAVGFNGGNVRIETFDITRTWLFL